jgi:DNA-binding MarR family transcriptional regulator
MSKEVRFSEALRSWMDVAMQRSMHGWSHHAKASGLSMPQFSILMQLYYRGNCGISDIRDRFEITAAAASQLVEKLVQAGLIERTEATEDRRAKQVQLSTKGRQLLEKGMSDRYRWMDGLSEGLDQRAQEQIASALVQLTDATRKLDSN